MAGHSKWAQIRHRKATVDQKRGQLFSKLVREIMVAVREKGVNPDTNLRLRSSIERARDEGLPKDNIERAIKRAAGGEEDHTLQEFLYEASAPGGVGLLIEGITDNTNRALAELRSVLTKHRGKFGDPGSIRWQFEKRGIIIFSPPKENPDAFALLLIEQNILDLIQEPDTWKLETCFEDTERVRFFLQEQGISLTRITHTYHPIHPISLSHAQMEHTQTLIEELDMHHDVQAVYANFG
ncbi:MAG: hypothetical protein G01um101466_824 [Parcubacteria group bacterium Gr01-1014_66]|nr:MAG: hypothetical protein G01um101466_824 [Parcubacteria group bacterium Gr01-1014_66]